MSKYYLHEIWDGFGNALSSPLELTTGGNDGNTEYTPASESAAPPGDENTQTWQREKLDWTPGPRYCYKPLLPPRGGIKNIRLLTLLPGSRKDRVIRCQIQHHCLNDFPDYETLSYVWGDLTGTVPVAVEDGSLNVTKNLMSALFHLRRESKPRVLWIDAICIDQNNVGERAQQVSFMRSIYQQASRTVVWLGEASANSDLAISTAAKLAEDAVFFAEDSKLKPKVDCKLRAGNYNPAALPQPAREAVEKLAQRPWFSRVWIVQEVVVAKEAIMVCGTSEISWDTFNRGIQVGTARNEFFRQAEVGFLHQNEFLGLQAIVGLGAQTMHVSAAEDLLDLLNRFRYWNATDPRDKVFALLGLVHEGVGTLGLSADYTVSVEEVYKRTALAILTALQNLDVLSSCLANTESELGKELPTWVPDWSSHDGLGKAFTVGDSQSTNWRATRNTIAQLEFFDDGKVLGLSGYTVDKIVEIGDRLSALDDNDTGPEPWVDESQFGDEQSARQNLKQAFEDLGYVYKLCMLLPAQLEIFIKWEQVARIDQKGKGPSGEDHTAVYWQTLCAGILPDGYEKTEEYFKEWYKSLSTVRRLVKLHINRLPLISQPLALAGYLKSTYQQISAFVALYTHALYRRMARTERGYLCLVPAETKAGDFIGLFKGGKVPLVITPTKDGFWKLIGESYVHGIMRGEAFDEKACEKMFFV
jgi:hypothetical protein